jgi:hypothetical protein
MAVKEMILIPIYWGAWWVPIQGNAYNWAEVNGLMSKIVEGRYMDGLNQYGIGRGSIAGTYVHQIDPPADGFGDSNAQWLFKMAIDDGHVPAPDNFDAETQQPFYSLLVKPGIEHLRDATPDGKVAQGTPDVGTGAYHFGFSYEYGDSRPAWTGQACWVKSTPTALGTVQRWVHEMAEAYSAGSGEISDMCESNHPVLVDGVAVPQYWSVADNSCWPPSDTMVPVSQLETERAGQSLAGGSPMSSVSRADRERAGGPLAGGGK